MGKFCDRISGDLWWLPAVVIAVIFIILFVVLGLHSGMLGWPPFSN